MVSLCYFFCVGRDSPRQGSGQPRRARSFRSLTRQTPTRRDTVAKHATGRLFDAARLSNLLRHTRKGTLVGHLARKFAINKVLRKLGL